MRNPSTGCGDAFAWGNSRSWACPRIAPILWALRELPAAQCFALSCSGEGSPARPHTVHIIENAAFERRGKRRAAGAGGEP